MKTALGVVGGIGVLTLAYFRVRYKTQLGRARNDIFNLANAITSYQEDPASHTYTLAGAVERIQTTNSSHETW